MGKRVEIDENVLDVVSGGSIAYTPDSYGAVTGTIGIDSDRSYRYTNFDDVYAYMAAHMKDKKWSSPSERDNYLMSGLVSAGIVTKA